VPPILRQELHFQIFRHYCDVNVALEASAELAYRRLVEVAVHDLERRTMERLRDDEARHVHAFRLLAGSLTEEGALAAGRTREALLADLAEVSPWFIPAAQRATGSKRRRRRSFGSGSPVVVRSARHDGERSATLTECLNRAGLGEMASAASTAAVRVSFMLGYDRRDHANVCSPELIEDLARYLAAHGVSDVAVLEAPTVYERAFAYRSVPEVARYFGFDSPAYRIVDISADLRAFVFERGFVQRALSATWADADLRIVVPKLRTDPIEFAHLGLSTLEGSTGPIDATFYAGRQVDFRSATMMLLDVAPPDFAAVEASNSLPPGWQVAERTRRRQPWPYQESKITSPGEFKPPPSQVDAYVRLLAERGVTSGEEQRRFTGRLMTGADVSLNHYLLPVRDLRRCMEEVRSLASSNELQELDMALADRGYLDGPERAQKLLKLVGVRTPRDQDFLSSRDIAGAMRTLSDEPTLTQVAECQILMEHLGLKEPQHQEMQAMKYLGRTDPVPLSSLSAKEIGQCIKTMQPSVQAMKTKTMFLSNRQRHFPWSPRL